MFYDNLKYLCEKNNTNITTVIKELGLSTGSIGNWKNGVTPKGDLVLRFADYFNVSTDFLLKGMESTDNNYHSDKVKELLEYYNALNDTEQNLILHKTATLYYETLRNTEKENSK